MRGTPTPADARSAQAASRRARAQLRGVRQERFALLGAHAFNIDLCAKFRLASRSPPLFSPTPSSRLLAPKHRAGFNPSEP